MRFMTIPLVLAAAGRARGVRGAAIPHAQRPARAAAVHHRRGVGAARAVSPRARARVGRVDADAGADAARPVVFDEIAHADYTVSKVYFESLPGFFVTGNLYRPIGAGPFPAILSPHGHWTYGRLENTAINSGPGRAIGLARQGFVVFTHDMVGYGDSRQVPHTFGGRRENLWGLSLGGLQLWNAIRALDFLETLPYVRRDGFGVTGESGGGSQTFLLGAVDPRVAVAVPVNMISLHMQGGCLCENMPGLRVDTNNVELAATIAPRPLLMVSATGDWTKETLENEYPAMRSLYTLLGAESKVQAVRFTAEHNYNKDSREAMYAWMARWLQHAPDDVKKPERSFTADKITDLLVFYNRSLPDGAVTAGQLTDQWIASAKAQIAASSRPILENALRHALGFGAEPPASAAPAKPARAHGRHGGRTARVRSAVPEGRLRRPHRHVHAVRWHGGRRRSSTSRPTTGPRRARRWRTSWPRCAIAVGGARRGRRRGAAGAAGGRHRAGKKSDRQRRRLRHLERRAVCRARLYSRPAAGRRFPDRRRHVAWRSHRPRRARRVRRHRHPRRA